MRFKALFVAALLAPVMFAADSQPRVLFDLSCYRHPAKVSCTIQPIVFVEQLGVHLVHYCPPLDGGAACPGLTDDEFIKRYYDAGTKYRVMHGGVAEGLATVEPEKHCCCQPIERGVTISGMGEDVLRRAVAVGSLTLKPHHGDPRPPTAAEQRKFEELAKAVLRIKGVDEEALLKLKLQAAAVHDLDGNGEPDVAGDFTIVDDKTSSEYILFLVAAGDGRGRLRADVIYFNHEDLRTESEEQAKSWNLVDYEDLDGDGTDELIVSENGYEWNHYIILKRGGNGIWNVAFEGGGSGC